MASPRTFSLNKQLFNAATYTRIREIWFAGLTPGTTAPPAALLKRWWQPDPAEREAFDAQLRSHFQPALDSVGPEELKLPSYTTADADRNAAASLAAPFLSEISA